MNQVIDGGKLMIGAEVLTEAADKLRVYDVEQGAWEQEPNGYVANATHVLAHLTKTMGVKHFSSKRTVETEIAPDSLQYALRLARWTQQEAGAVMPYQADIDGLVREMRLGNFRQLPEHQGAFLIATACLGIELHDEGHASTREKAVSRRQKEVSYIGRMLVHSATLQAEKFDFELLPAFDNRLAVLRERFDIPEPENVVS